MEEVELRLFLRLLLEQKRLIFWSVAICVALTTGITLLGIKREYTASSTLLYSQSSPLSAAGSIAGSLGLPLGIAQTGPASWFETILTSRLLAMKMVKKYNLVPVFGAKDEFEATGKLVDRIIITPKPEANAILVAVKIPGTPIRFPGLGLDRARTKLASDIANDLVSNLDSWMKTNDYQSSSKERKFIQNQLQDLLTQMTVTRLQLEGTFKQTGVFAPDDQGKALLDAMTQLETDIATAKAGLQGTRIMEQAGLSKDEISRLGATAEAAQKASALTDDLRKQLGAMELQLRQETQVNHKTDDHPDVVQLRQGIAELKSKLSVEVAIVNSAIGLEDKKLSAQLNLGQSRWSTLNSLLKRLPKQGLEVESLKHKLQAETDLLEMLEKQLLLAQIAEQQQSQNFNVLDAAQPPHQASSPSLVMGVAIGFALGFMIGLMLIGLRYFRQSLSRGHDDVAAAA